uniref:Uncharacterized protein n=1 Tax=Podoviridae sp. cti6G1 TaxID=2826570 RepID=A0A8S5LUN8_9CAUD|nr:MAG TPA: hypothetical protein [Podoviridae sp. cti6G1]
MFFIAVSVMTPCPRTRQPENTPATRAKNPAKS